jgi:hypothetical protein
MIIGTVILTYINFIVTYKNLSTLSINTLIKSIANSTD